MSDARPKAGWYRDPTRRHELRRWEGDGWSEWVIDAGRRNFDDLDGCGGPPQGEAVPVDEPRRPQGRRSKTGPRPPTAESGHNLVPDSEWASAALPIALPIAAGAGLFAGAIVAFGEADVLGGLGGPLAGEIVRRFLAPTVVALVVFEAVAAVGLAILARRSGASVRSPWSTMTGVARDEVLRGAIAFLLALFAHTFIVTTAEGGLRVRVAGPWWLFLGESALLILVAPVVEERLFRGVILSGLRHRFGPVVAVLGQSAVYGLAMSWSGVGSSRMVAALGMAAVGGVFGWFTYTTNDLRPVVVGHALLSLWFQAQRVLAG